MGYYVINNLIKERINMTNKEAKEIVHSMKSVDSLKAVKISYDLATQNADKMTALMKVVHGNVNNINLLAERIAKLERAWDLLEADLTKLDKRLELVEDGLERVVKKQVEDYEQRKN